MRISISSELSFLPVQETLLKDIEDGDRTKLLLNAADACDRCNTLWACIVSVPNDEIVKPDADEDGEDNAQQASKPSARRKLSWDLLGV